MRHVGGPIRPASVGRPSGTSGAGLASAQIARPDAGERRRADLRPLTSVESAVVPGPGSTAGAGVRGRAGARSASDVRIAGELVLAISVAAAIAVALTAGFILLLGHTESTEQIGYLSAIVGVVSGVVAARKLSQRADDRVGTVAMFNAFGLASLTWGDLLVRQIHGIASVGGPLVVFAGAGVVLAVDLAWWLRPSSLARVRALPSGAEVALGLLALAVAALPFIPISDHSPQRLAVAGVLGAVLAVGATQAWRWRPAASLRVVVDLVVCALLLLVIVDLQYHADSTAGNIVVQHLNFELGPVNDVLHGRTVLVNTFSQYGVGVIYAIAGVYRLSAVRPSYGSFELGLGLATVVWFWAIYWLLRRATRSQAIAVGAIALAVVTDLLGSYSFTSYPMAGVLRFGPPFVVLLLLVTPRPAHRARRAALWFVALISLWSVETFAYTLGVALPLLLAEAWLHGGPLPTRLVRFARGVAGVVVATVVVQAAFAGLTRLAAGSWPDWGTYLDYVGVYARSGFGDVLIAPFSPGLALGLVLLASAVATLAFTLRASDLSEVVRSRLPLLAGLTGYGVTAYTYFIARSADEVPPKIALPVCLLAAIWLDLAVLRRPAATRPPLKRPQDVAVGRALGAIANPRHLFAFVACSAALIVGLDATGGATFDVAWRSTALAVLANQSAFNEPLDSRALQGRTFPTTLGGRLDELLASAVASPYPEEAAAEQIVRRLGAGRSVAVLLGPEVTTEVLIRTARKNALPIASPSQDALLPSARRRIDAAIRRLPSGTLLITDRSALAGVEGRPPPGEDPSVAAGQILYLKLRVRLLRDLAGRFDERPVAGDRSGAVAVRLVRRPSAGG